MYKTALPRRCLYDGPSVEEQIKNFFFHDRFLRGENKTFFLDHSRGRVNKTLFSLPLQKEGKYISINDVQAGRWVLDMDRYTYE